MAQAPALASSSYALAGFDATVPSSATDPWAVISNTWVINNNGNLVNSDQQDTDSIEAWMRDGTGYVFGGQEEWVDPSTGYHTDFYTCAMTTDGSIHCSQAIDASQYYGDQIANALQRSAPGNDSSYWENVLWLPGTSTYTFGPWQIFGSQAGEGSVYEKTYSTDASTACEPSGAQVSWVNLRYNDTGTGGGNGFPSTSPDTYAGCGAAGSVQGDPSWGAQAFGVISAL